MAETGDERGGPFRPLPYAHYDRRGYRTRSIEDGYAGWSRVYDEGMSRRFDIDLFERAEWLAGRVAGARVVDLGCGTGRIGAWLAARGAARIDGVDRSPDMLAHAAARRVYGALVERDLTATGLDGAAWDGVITSMALCHVASLDAFYAECRRLLVAGGWLALVDFHPFFLMQGVPSHYDDPEAGEPIAIENHLHASSEHFRAAARAGFTWRAFEERFVDAAWVEYARRFLGWPITFLLAWERAPS